MSKSGGRPRTQRSKIGYVLKRYPRFSETFIVNEIHAHEAAGQPVEIFALRSVEESHFQDILGQIQAPVIRVNDRFSGPDVIWELMGEANAKLPGAWEALGKMGEMPGRDIAQAIIVALACRHNGIVHLHAHFGTVATAVARLAAALANIGYSFTAHAKDIYCAYDETHFLDLKLRDAAATVTVSDYNVDFLRNQFGLETNQITRIYNGLDLDRFTYVSPSPDATEILAVGRLVEKKGFHILIEAIRLLRSQGLNVSCKIIGGGEEMSNLSSQIEVAGLGDVVALVGSQPQGEVVRAMREAAVLACPCVVGTDGNRDGLPTVLLEAMALGLPSLATDVTGIPEIVRNEETGICVAEGDPEALAAALERMLDDSNLRLKLSKSARELVELEFNVMTNSANLRKVFDNAIAKRLEMVREVA